MASTQSSVNDLEQILYAKGYRIRTVNGREEWYKGVAPVSFLQDPITEPNLKHGGEGANPPQAPNPRRRIRVCITSHRRRLLDPDNLFVKWVVDGLRYNGVIPDDSSKHIELIIRQEQVQSKALEKTTIDVTPL